MFRAERLATDIHRSLQVVARTSPSPAAWRSFTKRRDRVAASWCLWSYASHGTEPAAPGGSRGSVARGGASPSSVTVWETEPRPGGPLYNAWRIAREPLEVPPGAAARSPSSRNSSPMLPRLTAVPMCASPSSRRRTARASAKYASASRCRPSSLRMKPTSLRLMLGLRVFGADASEPDGQGLLVARQCRVLLTERPHHGPSPSSAVAVRGCLGPPTSRANATARPAWVTAPWGSSHQTPCSPVPEGT